MTLGLIGGDPSTDPGLQARIASLKATGIRVGMQTHGRGLAETLPALVEAGLRDIHFSIHGPHAGLHDYHTGVEGSFEESRASLRRARDLGLTIAVTTVLTRSNYRVLAEFPAFLRRHRVTAWAIAGVRGVGRAATNYPRLQPSLSLAVPFALHALHQAEREGIEPYTLDLPLCVLGPYARWSLTRSVGAYGQPCNDCPARPRCPGIDPHYLDRFGPRELRPRSLPPARTLDAAPLFDGPGMPESETEP